MAKGPDKTHKEVMEKIDRHNLAMVETHKMEFDIHKTQATLVTGTLVAVIALANLLVQGSPRYSLVLAASFVLLLFSMGWSIAVMLQLTTAVMLRLSPWSNEDAGQEQSNKAKNGRWVTLASFPLGLGLFRLLCPCKQVYVTLSTKLSKVLGRYLQNLVLYLWGYLSRT